MSKVVGAGGRLVLKKADPWNHWLVLEEKTGMSWGTVIPAGVLSETTFWLPRIDRRAEEWLLEEMLALMRALEAELSSQE